MANANQADYQLPALTPRLQRRQGWLVTTGLLAIFTPIVMIGVALDIPAARGGFLIGCLGVTALAVIANRVLYVATAADQRQMIAASSQRLLPPLPPVALGIEIPVELEPGWFARRKTTIAKQIILDDRGISVPVWAIGWVPRALRKGGQSHVFVEWVDIERWRVRSDSDGSDTYDIETKRPWYPTERTRWPTLQVRRSVICDELLVLDTARAVGQVSIDLETSLDPHHRTG